MEPTVHAPTAAQRAVLDCVAHHPGLPLQEVARRVGRTIATISYHVDRLEERGRLRSIRSGRRRLVYPSSDDDEGPFARGAVLHDPSARKVADALLLSGGCHVADLRALTGLSRRAVYHQLGKLRDAGLIRCHRPRSYAEISLSEAFGLLVGEARRAEPTAQAPESA